MSKEEMLDSQIAGYSEKLKQNPNSLVFVQLADAMRKRGRFEEALGVLEEGLTRNPNLLSALIMTGRIHIARDRHGEAIDVLKRAIGREPGNLTAHALLSQAYLATNSLREAIVEFQKILSLNPEDASAQQALQTVLARMKKDKGDGPKPKQEVAKAPVKSAPEEKSGAPPAMELPAYAAAEELLARGLFDEAAEAFQRILDADPENALARMKLQEAHSMRDATETPASVADRSALPSGPVQTHADKITDDEILSLLGIMESSASAGEPGAAETLPPLPTLQPKAEKAPAAPVSPVSESEPPPSPSEPVPAAALPPAEPPEPERSQPSAPEAPKPAPAEAETKAPGQESLDEEKVLEVLNRLTSTEGMRQAFLLNGPQVISSGPGGTQEREKIVTLVKMLSDVTRRAATQMKQGEVRQVLVFGTEGIVMVSPASVGILAAVAGAAVRVGLMRIALNDCLKRLAEVS